jgi:hypothetical protein
MHMKPSAVLLIDLENFFCSREDYCRKSAGPSYDRARFKDDLARLLAYARGMTAARDGAELPFTVRRAYADYNAVRYVGGGPQHYLRSIPEEVLSQGVEPVQVFRLSRGGKNAADMKMATDATSLLFTAAHAEHFVLVTGDADFIPVILELKRHGRSVSVIGVTGATSPKLQRFVDNFELFEDLLAAEEAEARAGQRAPAADGIGPVAAALHRLLARTRPLRFAAVKPLLSKELGRPFDPAAFGCDTTGDFLRARHAELGVAIRQGPHDSEIDLPDGSPSGPAHQHAKPGAPEPHSAAHYKLILASPRPSPDRAAKVYTVPWPVLVWACDAVVPLLAPPTGEPTASAKLLPKLLAASEADAVKYARLFYPTLRAGLPAPAADGLLALPDGATGELVRGRVLRYVAHALKGRLGGDEVRAEALAAVFEPGAAAEQAAAEFAAALAAPPLDPAPPTPKPTPVEDLHTAAAYIKLLKAGGPKGSETEAFKVLPVPWPSVERVCADAFALLDPSAGSPSVPRDLLIARLTDAGKELCPEHYNRHARRVLGVLRLAGDVVETGDAVALAPDVTSGYDLRSRALAFLLQLLQLRLEERGVYSPIHPHTFVAALEAGPYAGRLLEEVTPAVAWLYRPDADTPADTPPAESAVIDFSAVPIDHAPGELSAVNMAALTSEAVAAASADEPIAEAIPVPDTPPGMAEEMGAARPATEWPPMDDPAAFDLSTADVPVLLPDPQSLEWAPLDRVPLPPPPAVDRMKPPPLPRRLPPPLPPLPPESA